MKKRLFETKTKGQSWRRKATTRIVVFAVVFVLLSPFLLVPNTAHAFSFGDLAGSIIGGAFSGGESYVGGSVLNYLTGKLPSGFNSIVNQRIHLQELYDPAMEEFMEKMDESWISSIPGFFTITLFSQQDALQTYVGSDEPRTFQEEGHYSGLAQNAKSVSYYLQNKSAAESAYQEAQEDFEEATESGVVNQLGSGSEVAKDITASQAAFDSMAITSLMGQGGGGAGDAIGKIVGVATTIASFFGI